MEIAKQEKNFEIGLYTFGDLMPDRQTGQPLSAEKRLQEIMAMAKLADEAGLDVFGVGEHHRLDFAISSPAVVLAAIAQQTDRIKLTSATSVLSTLDPVRLFQDFATLDLLSHGRAEIIAGRGAFVESFPLFGQDLNDYNKLFSEKIKLLIQLNAETRVTWKGNYRSALNNIVVAPRPVQPEIPIWIGVGGTPESAVRAGTLGKGMALALLGGDPRQFKPLVDLYRESGAKAGHNPEDLQIAITSHGYIAKTSQQAVEEFQPYYDNYFGRLMRERGRFMEFSREQLQAMTPSNNALALGSPQQVIDKILYQHELFSHNRFIAQMDVGGLPFSKIAKAIELLATEVAPVVRRELKLIGK
jgi:probable LLM family oxidoreductase